MTSISNSEPFRRVIYLVHFSAFYLSVSSHSPLESCLIDNPSVGFKKLTTDSIPMKYAFDIIFARITIVIYHISTDRISLNVLRIPGDLSYKDLLQFRSCWRCNTMFMLMWNSEQIRTFVVMLLSVGFGGCRENNMKQRGK